MQRQLVFILLFCCSFFLAMDAAAAEDSITISSTLRSVTVYRSGAEMVHTATARLAQGNNELVIGDVSNSIDPANIRIRCSANVTIMSVAFSTDYLKPAIVSPSKTSRKSCSTAAALPWTGIPVFSPGTRSWPPGRAANTESVTA